MIDSNAALCRQWAAVKGDAAKVGRHIETADAWIAATARLYAAALITHNAADFAHLTGLAVITET